MDHTSQVITEDIVENTMMVETLGNNGTIHNFVPPEEEERTTIEEIMEIGLETTANNLGIMANGLEITAKGLEIEIEDQFQEATNPEEVLNIEATDITIRHQTVRLYKPQYK